VTERVEAGSVIRLTGYGWADNWLSEQNGIYKDKDYEVIKSEGSSVWLKGVTDETLSWYVDDKPQQAWAYELVSPAPKVKLEPEVSSTTVKYAAQLSPLDIANGKMISWIKRYRYAKEDREKVMVVYRPYLLTYQAKTDKDTVILRGYKTQYTKYEWDIFDIPVGTEVVVSDIL